MRVFIGDETGLLKNVSIDKSTVVHRWGKQERSRAVLSTCWGGSQQERESYLAAGLASGVVEVYDSNDGSLVKEVLSVDERVLCDVTSAASTSLNMKAKMLGVSLHGESLATGFSTGCVRYQPMCIDEDISERKNDDDIVLRVAKTLSTVCFDETDHRRFLCGGDEEDLTLWDVSRLNSNINGTSTKIVSSDDAAKAVVFKAKNVKNDMLDLRPPVWVTASAFIPSSSLIAAGTRFHEVKLYDIRAGRRPALILNSGKHPVTALRSTNDGRSLFVADSVGVMRSFDIRTGKHLGFYKGSSGSICAIATHPTLPVVASVGADRFVRIHSIDTRRLISKVYVKQRLSTVLFSSELSEKEMAQEKESTLETLEDTSRDVGEDDEEHEQMWRELESGKRKRSGSDDDDDSGEPITPEVIEPVRKKKSTKTQSADRKRRKELST